MLLDVDVMSWLSKLVFLILMGVINHLFNKKLEKFKADSYKKLEEFKADIRNDEKEREQIRSFLASDRRERLSKIQSRPVSVK